MEKSSSDYMGKSPGNYNSIKEVHQAEHLFFYNKHFLRITPLQYRVSSEAGYGFCLQLTWRLLKIRDLEHMV